jgi:hypothetical protein
MKNAMKKIINIDKQRIVYSKKFKYPLIWFNVYLLSFLERLCIYAKYTGLIII